MIQRKLAEQDRVKYLHARHGDLARGRDRGHPRRRRRPARVPFELGIPRVYTVLKLDERRDKEQTLAGQGRAVQRRLKDGG